jgi:hypothetical protein
MTLDEVVQLAESLKGSNLRRLSVEDVRQRVKIVPHEDMSQARSKIMQIWLAIGLMACAMTAQAQKTEFKGVPFGASEAQFHRTLPKFYCNKPEKADVGYRMCVVGEDDKVEFGGVIPKLIVANFLRDHLVSVMVTVRGDDFQTVVRALKSKFGKVLPYSKGKTFEWTARDGIYITAEGGGVDGLIFIRNDTAAKEILDRAGAAAAKSL